MTPPGTAGTSRDDPVWTDDTPATEVRDRLQVAGDALRALAADPRLADPAAHRTALAAGIDDLIDEAADALAAVSAFGMPQAGFGDLYRWRAETLRRACSPARRSSPAS